MTLCLLGVLQGPANRKDTAIKTLKIPIPLWLSRAGPALRNYSLHWTVGCTRGCGCECTASARGQSLLSLTPGWVWGHRTTALTHLLGWDRTTPPGSEDHYILLPLTQGKSSHRTSVLFNLGQSRACACCVFGDVT